MMNTRHRSLFVLYIAEVTGISARLVRFREFYSVAYLRELDLVRSNGQAAADTFYLRVKFRSSIRLIDPDPSRICAHGCPSR
jgi:hypothetical protein